MQIEKVSFPSSNQLFDVKALAYDAINPKAIVQIVHGMAEFKERYDDFAKYLAAQGFVVFVSDHIGHGESIDSENDFGYFGGQNGWQHMVEDVRLGHDYICQKFPALPYFILGHSMGSFIARDYMTKYHDLKGVLLSGTAGNDPGAKAAVQMIKLMSHFKGERHRSEIIQKMAFQGYNQHFENRTTKDWLTRDQQIVDAYINDKRNMFNFTLNGYRNLFEGLHYIFSKKALQQIDLKVPIYLFSGSQDPVGQYGKGVIDLYHQYKDLGVIDVEVKLYPGGRHEMLNEINKDEVYADVLDWLNRKLK